MPIALFQAPSTPIQVAWRQLRAHHHGRRENQIPIALAAQPAPNFPRLRALALLGRRPPECEAPHVIPASKNLHRSGHPFVCELATAQSATANSSFCILFSCEAEPQTTTSFSATRGRIRPPRRFFARASGRRGSTPSSTAMRSPPASPGSPGSKIISGHAARWSRSSAPQGSASGSTAKSSSA